MEDHKTPVHTVKVAVGRTRASTSPEEGKSTTCLSDVQNSRLIQKMLVKGKANYRRNCMDNLYKISHTKKTLAFYGQACSVLNVDGRHTH